MKIIFATILLLCSSLVYADTKLSRPDDKPADMTKPVQVFILMGQSNMLGFGDCAKLKGVAAEKYPYLVDDGGNWLVRKDVRNVFFCMAQKKYNNWLTAEDGNGSGKIGPEVGIGWHLGQNIDAPVMILKVCVGNRSLGWDLLPPSAVGTGKDGKSYQGNSESSNRKINEEAKAKNGWYAGLQYDQDVGAAQTALKDLATYYPGAKEYEVAGFFWWQGNAEPGKGSVENYDKNLAFLFNDLRKDFNAPNAKFVCATLGEHDMNATLSQKMYAFAKLPEFKDQAAVFFTKAVSKGGSGNGHYNGNPETYMNVGEGMGAAMVELLKNSIKNTPKTTTNNNQNDVPKNLVLTKAQQAKMPELVKSILVDMSKKKELKEISINISKTKANVWLAKMEENGDATFQLMNDSKQAVIKYNDLNINDMIVLGRLIAAIRTEDATAQAVAGFCITLVNNSTLAKTYFTKSNSEAIQNLLDTLSK